MLLLVFLNECEVLPPGVFILSVHPANLANYRGGGGRREEDFRFYDLWMVNKDPNPEYILRNVNGKQSLLPVIITNIKPKRKFDIIHHNGWIERTTPPRMRDKELEELKAMQYDPIRSKEREAYLSKTVAYLKKYGKVVLVRMPVSSAAKHEEDKFFDFRFGLTIKAIADKNGIPYFDYSGEGDAYEFNDGIHHLDGPSAEKFTRRLARDIAALQ